MDKKYVIRRYKNPRNPGSLAGLSGFLRNNKYEKPTEVEEALETLDSYVSHKPSRKRFPRRPMIVPDIDSVWSIDLADMQHLKGHAKNRRYSFILVAVDGLSKKLFTSPIKKKTQTETKDALENIMTLSKRRPRMIFADRGTEFRNKSVQSFLKSKNIHLYHSFSHLKAFQAERVIRTLKARLYRYMTQNKNSDWVSGLEDITKSINASYNRAIGMASDEVSKNSVSTVWHNLYHSVVKQKKTIPKYEKGDKVRVSVKKLSVGSKSYTKSFGPEVFTIKDILEYHPIPVYKLQDTSGVELEGGFNQFELAKVL